MTEIEEARQRARRAYEMRLDDYSWPDISAAVYGNGVKWNNCYKRAMAYALQNKLEWPVGGKKWNYPNPPPGRNPSVEVQQSGRRCYEMRLAGHSWPSIAEVGNIVQTAGKTAPAVKAHSRARLYAYQANLPWPIKFERKKGGRTR